MSRRFSLTRSNSAKDTASKAGLSQPKDRRMSTGKSQMALLSGEKVLQPIFFELPLPLGVGLDELNVVQEIGESGSAASSGIEPNDRLSHVDGRDVRDGKLDVAEALDRSRSTHTLVLQRMVVPEPGVSYLTVRLTPKGGSLGIGLTEKNVISELVRDSASDLDGRLQVNAPREAAARQPSCE